MKKIVTVGGGTGSFTVLSGLKNIENIDIAAIVSMADDGGSTGVLRDELGVLPPGDVRQCLVALSLHSNAVRDLMNYRFNDGALKGHSFGNIFLAALEKTTGDFVSGVEVASEILKVKGSVIPVTSSKAELLFVLKDGSILEGENKINHADLQNTGIQEIKYKEKVSLNENADKVIGEADYIILGPGNYYCSLVPNLIIGQFKEAIKNTKAKIIFPINLTNKHGHTTGWKASNYLNDIERYLDRKVDFILINNQKPTEEQIESYEIKEGDGVLVEDDLDNSRVYREDLLSTVVHEKNKNDTFQASRGFIRHDSSKLEKVIAKIINS